MLVYGKPQWGYLQVIVCSWRIPVGASGKTLRIWNYAPRGGDGHAAIVRINPGIYASPLFTWRIAKP